MKLKNLLEKIKKGRLEIYLYTNYQGYIEVSDLNNYKYYFELESFDYLKELEVKQFQVKVQSQYTDELETKYEAILDVTLVE